MLGARGEVAPAIAALQNALAEHARRPLRREIARTLLELGALQRRAKRKTSAKQSLEQALAMFEAMGAQMWVARTRDELGRIGFRRAVVSDGLTPAQQRVAELVASGMSNREVASALYMSLRSVDPPDKGLPGARRQLALAACRDACDESPSDRRGGLICVVAGPAQLKLLPGEIAPGYFSEV